jgi:transposase
VTIKLTAGQEADSTHAGSLLQGRRPVAVIADKGYDSDRIRAQVRASGAKVVIPPLKCRKAVLRYDRRLYRERNRAERFWAAVKRCRRVATRYEKLARNFLAFVHLASAYNLLTIVHTT